MRETKRNFQKELKTKSEVNFSELLADDFVNNNTTPNSDNITMNDVENINDNIINLINDTSFRINGPEYKMHTLLRIQNVLIGTSYKVPATNHSDLVKQAIIDSGSVNLEKLIGFVDHETQSMLKVLFRNMGVIESDQLGMLDAGLPYWTNLKECNLFKEDYYFELKMIALEERQNSKGKKKKKKKSSSVVRIITRRGDGISHIVAMRKLNLNASQYAVHRRDGLPMTSLDDDRAFIQSNVVKTLNKDYGEFENQKEFANACGVHPTLVSYYYARGIQTNLGVVHFLSEMYKYKSQNSTGNRYEHFSLSEWAELLDVPESAISNAYARFPNFFSRSLEEIEADFERCYSRNKGFVWRPDPAQEKIDSIFDAIENGESDNGLIFNWEDDRQVA